MRSDLVKKGSTRAAHRSLFYALGFSDEDLKKPMIAVVNAQNAAFWQPAACLWKFLLSASATALPWATKV